VAVRTAGDSSLCATAAELDVARVELGSDRSVVTPFRYLLWRHSRALAHASRAGSGRAAANTHAMAGLYDDARRSGRRRSSPQAPKKQAETAAYGCGCDTWKQATSYWETAVGLVM